MNPTHSIKSDWMEILFSVPPFFVRTTVLATIDYAILGLPLLQTTSIFHGKISRESTLSIARIRTAPASAGSAPPRGDSAPVVLSQDRPARAPMDIGEWQC